MGLFETMVQNMERMEFFQYLFPFILSFAILYGVLKWVFKDKIEPRIIGLISAMISFFVMLFSASNPWLYMMLSAASGVWLGMATVLIFIVVLTSLAGVNLLETMKNAPGWLKYAAILVIIYLFVMVLLGSGSLSSWLPYWLTGSDIWTVILVIIILGIVFWFIGGKDESSAAAPEPGK